MLLTLVHGMPPACAQEVLTMGLAWRRIMRVPVSLVHDTDDSQALGGGHGSGSIALGLQHTNSSAAGSSHQVIILQQPGVSRTLRGMSEAQVHGYTAVEEQLLRARLSGTHPNSSILHSGTLPVTARPTALAAAAAEAAATTEAFVSAGITTTTMQIMHSQSERMSGSMGPAGASTGLARAPVGMKSCSGRQSNSADGSGQGP
jgi:hypothetical protein